MRTNKIKVEDIKAIGPNSSIVVELPNYLSCISAKNLVGYVKKAYPRDDGMKYFTSIDGNVITIGTKCE